MGQKNLIFVSDKSIRVARLRKGEVLFKTQQPGVHSKKVPSFVDHFRLFGLQNDRSLDLNFLINAKLELNDANGKSFSRLVKKETPWMFAFKMLRSGSQSRENQWILFLEWLKPASA